MSGTSSGFVSKYPHTLFCTESCKWCSQAGPAVVRRAREGKVSLAPSLRTVFPKSLTGLTWGCTPTRRMAPTQDGLQVSKAKTEELKGTLHNQLLPTRTLEPSHRKHQDLATREAKNQQMTHSPNAEREVMGWRSQRRLGSYLKCCSWQQATISKKAEIQAPALTGMVPGCFASFTLPSLPQPWSPPQQVFQNLEYLLNSLSPLRHYCFNKYQVPTQSPMLGWVPMSLKCRTGYQASRSRLGTGRVAKTPPLSMHPL